MKRIDLRVVSLRRRMADLGRVALVGVVLVGCGSPTPAPAPRSPVAPPSSTPAPVGTGVEDAKAMDGPSGTDAGPSAATADEPTPPPSRPRGEPGPPVPAAYGTPLEPGSYVFPDGLELRVMQIANCDFDTSVPCFGGTYRAHAKLGAKEASVEWSTKSTTVLGRRLELSRMRVVVRK